MKNKIRIGLVLLIVLYAMACKDFLPFDQVSSFWVENKSDELVYFLVSYQYPDTIIPDTYEKRYGVSAGSKRPFDSKEKWEVVFDKLPADTLSIFIFSSDTLDTYDWQTIRSGYKIMKRYDVSLDDLKQNQWIITYP